MQEWRTLSEDDIEGAQHLYGTAAAASNTAPTVSILTPLSGSVFPEGAVISFSGVASDVEDGNLTAQLSWLSTLQGAIGTGVRLSFSICIHSHSAHRAFSRSLLGQPFELSSRLWDIGSSLRAMAPSSNSRMIRKWGLTGRSS
jgi:hypothetical protein